MFGAGQLAAFAQELGDIPLAPDVYQENLKILPEQLRDAQPAAYDARDDGIVTPAKNQGGCGSCWAFASAGAMESHLLKEWGYGPTDLAEQQLLSCNPFGYSCAGGSSDAMTYWNTVYDNGPIPETCFPYTASGATPCSYSCTEMVTRVTNWHTVPQTTEDFKASCYYDGPSYWRFNVYSDFSDGAGHGFWYDASPGAVYVNRSATSFRGGHAVLLIGWDDAKGAFLCKNSWGTSAGPNGDGTFWIAYSGHYNNLSFGMSNFDVINEPDAWDYCFNSSHGSTWYFNVIDDTIWPYLILSGYVEMGSGEIRAATASYNGYNVAISFAADEGSIPSGVPFNYNFRFSGPTGSGVWINASPTAGHGTVTVTLCDAADTAQDTLPSGQQVGQEGIK
jgi:C1A family cysteine protease